jgi:hypothetical protein
MPAKNGLWRQQAPAVKVRIIFEVQVVTKRKTCSACAVETRGLADDVCDAPGLENSALTGLSLTDLLALGLDEFTLRRPAGCS